MSAAAAQGVARASLQRRANVFGAGSVLFYQRAAGVRARTGLLALRCRRHAVPGCVQQCSIRGSLPPTRRGGCGAAARELNIHSRYLHAGIIDYAERLMATLPPSLSNITFTCTGSESNDLALRLAAKFTGGQGMIVTEAAYHGNTESVSQVSPSSHRHWRPPRMCGWCRHRCLTTAICAHVDGGHR
jgi:hypothetical protein